MDGGGAERLQRDAGSQPNEVVYPLSFFSHSEADGTRPLNFEKNKNEDLNADSRKKCPCIRRFLFSLGVKNPSVFTTQTMPRLLQSFPFSCRPVFEMSGKGACGELQVFTLSEADDASSL